MNSPSANAGLDSQPRYEAAKNQSLIHRLSVVLYPDQILRAVCQPVDTFDSALRDLAEEMFSLMQYHCGIGLAAPQVGLRHRLIVCGIKDQLFALTNFEVKDATEPRDFAEGCVSLPGIQVNVRRPERIRVTGYDLHGQRRSFGAVGLWARVIQHELDHLNGVLICDKNITRMKSASIAILSCRQSWCKTVNSAPCPSNDDNMCTSKIVEIPGVRFERAMENATRSILVLFYTS